MTLSSEYRYLLCWHIDLPSQERFFMDNSVIDIYVPVEGEIGFANIVKKASVFTSISSFIQI